MYRRTPDKTCYFCDGAECKIKRILDRIAFGKYCLMGNSGGKEECKLFNRANKEGLILFFKEEACNENTVEVEIDITEKQV